jgi:hypothetical protein
MDTLREMLIHCGLDLFTKFVFELKFPPAPPKPVITAPKIEEA